MNEKYKKIIKWVVGITIGVTVLILLIVFIKPSSSLPPNMVNCCIKDQCHQLKTADCVKQGGVPDCNTCGVSGVNCGHTMLSCTTDNDCHNCQEFRQGVQMSCVQSQGSSGGKVCAPTNAKQECKTEYGGINVWSEWDNPDRMEWDCLCVTGNYAAGANPDGNTVCNINPDICQKGTFTWDVSKKTNPDAGYCFCPSGTTMYTQISGGYPICIPTDGLTEMMYTDLYAKDGRSCPNLCVRGTCGKDSKCVCDMGWDDGADCNSQSAIKDFGTTRGAIALTSNAALGLHVTPGQPITLDMPTPVNTTSEFSQGKPTSLLIFHTTSSIFLLTIDETTGHILPTTTDDHTTEWSLSKSPTTGHLVGKKLNVYYFATGPEKGSQKGSVITMKEQSTLTSADNILSFTAAACTQYTCTDQLEGLCTPDILWSNGVNRFMVNNECTIVNILNADGSFIQFGTLQVIGDKGFIAITTQETLTSNNVNTSVINWVSDTGDAVQWTVVH